MPDEAKDEILLLDLSELKIIKRIKISDALRIGSGDSATFSVFSAKATCLLSNTTSLILASEDKCLRVIPLTALDNCEAQSLTPLPSKNAGKKTNK